MRPPFCRRRLSHRRRGGVTMEVRFARRPSLPPVPQRIARGLLAMPLHTPPRGRRWTLRRVRGGGCGHCVGPGQLCAGFRAGCPRPAGWTLALHCSW